MAQFKTQDYVKSGPVVKIFFNKPHRRNATDIEFYEDLLECFDLAEADEEVRAVILGGHGPVMCAGQDLKWSASASSTDFRRYEDLLRIAWNRIRRFPKPVIARVHGDAYGGGMYMATRSDLIVMKHTAKMAMREIQAGEESGGTHVFTVGKQRAMELNLLGREVNGIEAERWNLVNATYETEEEMDQQIDEWVDRIVSLPPQGVTMTKIHQNFLLDAAGFDLHWDAPFGRLLELTEDRMEAKRAWVEKRPPVYKNR